MIKKLITCCALFASIYPVIAQSIPVGPPGGRVQFQRTSSGFITSLPPAPPSTEGHFFLREEWLRGDILLEDSTLMENMLFRLNLKDNSLEIKDNNTVKILPGKRVLYFAWENNTSPADGSYWNVGLEKNSGLTGFARLHYKGDYSLVQRTSLEVISATYNTALDVGSKNHQVSQKDDWYVHHDGRFMKIERNRKKFWNDLSQLAGKDCRQLFGDARIDTNDPDDVIPILKKLESTDIP